MNKTVEASLQKIKKHQLEIAGESTKIIDEFHKKLAELKK